MYNFSHSGIAISTMAVHQCIHYVSFRLVSYYRGDYEVRRISYIVRLSPHPLCAPLAYSLGIKFPIVV